MNYVQAVLKYLKVHWLTVVALGTILYTIDKPYIAAYVQAHPSAAVIYANIAAIVGFYLKSPLTKVP